MRDSERVTHGPPGLPGPPGPPGYTQWFGSHRNATDLVEYIKCKRFYFFTNKQRILNPNCDVKDRKEIMTKMITKQKSTLSMSLHMYLNLPIK